MDSELRDQITEVVQETNKDLKSRVSRMSSLVGIVMELDPRIFWVGFYLKVPGEDVLEIGPYQGPPPCTQISFDKGICGEAAKTRKTQIIDDVRKLPNYIACHEEPLSEIVVPVVDKESNELIGVLDIDSDQTEEFSQDDEPWLLGLLKTI